MDRDVLVGDAAAAAGATRADVEHSLADADEPLALVVESLRADAALTPAGREFTERWLTRLIAERHRLDQFVAADPAVIDESIDAPVIVAGAPRTGTTFLHGLLAQTPSHRAPQGWELLYPAPPPGTDPADDERRITAADDELTWPQRQREAMLSIHRYAGRMPKECLSAMSFSFRSEEFISRYRVPRYVDWLQSCDMAPAYSMHRLVLQVLQRRQATSQWVLKSPVHLNNLGVVLATYPDARLIITHREPTEILGSVTSLVANLRRAFSDDVDEGEIARYHLDLYGRSLDALVDAELSTDRVIHIDQRGLIAQPQETIDHICTQFDLTPATLDASPPVEAGRHDYTLAGVDPGEIDATFARYRERFLSGP